MAFKIVFQEMNVEKITKGKNFFEKGVVTYTYNGANKQQTLMSFANPDVFKTLRNAAPGTEFSVETSKNAAGYDQWSKVEALNGYMGETKKEFPKPANSTYETKEERAARQVLIVRQSSLSAAVGTLSAGSKSALDPEVVKKVAEDYVSWVMQTDVPPVFEDVPH